MKVLAIILITFIIHQIAGLPSDSSSFNYASTSSQIIATSLIKHHKNDDTNNVFSPIAVVDILAILAEGSVGKTFEEFSETLGFPKKKEDLRKSFKQTLQTFTKNDHFDLEKSPSFSTWFYIYQNNTANQEYKDILTKYYDVQVKDISRTIYDWDSIDTSPKSSTTSAPLNEATTHHNDRDIPDFETLKSLPSEEEEIEFPDKPSKFDTNIDDKEYVDVSVIREQQTTLTPEIVKNEVFEPKEQDNETIQESEKVSMVKKTLHAKETKSKNSSGPEKITLPLRDIEMARSISEGARTLFKKDDVVSALSANSITGRAAGSKSKMILFNGLYYRGNWAYPFQELRSSPKDEFFVTPEKTVLVTLMRTAGKFNYMDCEHLKAEIIEFPYENDQYSLLVFLPKDDIKQLIDRIEPVDLQNVRKSLELKELFISLPKFQIEQTCRSEEVLKNLGLKTLFSKEESQLSLISEDKDLHVEEVVQFTNMQVDEGACSENALTASNIKSRDISDNEIKINTPFIYFVLNKDSVVMVSGKVMNPTYKEPEDVDLDVEFTLA